MWKRCEAQRPLLATPSSSKRLKTGQNFSSWIQPLSMLSCLFVCLSVCLSVSVSVCNVAFGRETSTSRAVGVRVHSSIGSSFVLFHSYFDNIRRLVVPSYVPNDQDILRSRLKTTGICECTLTIEGNVFQYASLPVLGVEMWSLCHCAGWCLTLSPRPQVSRRGRSTGRTTQVDQLFPRRDGNFICDGHIGNRPGARRR